MVRDRLLPGEFLPPSGLVESIGLTAALVNGTAFLSVFLLVPRPLVDREPALTRLPRMRPTREFRFPTDRTTEGVYPVQQNRHRPDGVAAPTIRRLNALGVLAFLLWIGTQLFVA